jgi:hypothetical protein
LTLAKSLFGVSKRRKRRPNGTVKRREFGTRVSDFVNPNAKTLKNVGFFRQSRVATIA